MDARTIKRGFYALLAATGVGLALIALFLLSRSAQNSEDFNRLHIVILSINVLGVLVLFMLLVGNLARLLREYRTHVPGARLKARIVGMFVGLAVLPLLVVFYSSVSGLGKLADARSELVAMMRALVPNNVISLAPLSRLSMLSSKTNWRSCTRPRRRATCWVAYRCSRFCGSRCEPLRHVIERVD